MTSLVVFSKPKGSGCQNTIGKFGFEFIGQDMGGDVVHRNIQECHSKEKEVS